MQRPTGIEIVSVEAAVRGDPRHVRSQGTTGLSAEAAGRSDPAPKRAFQADFRDLKEWV
jgi:hypothetical protein